MWRGKLTLGFPSGHVGYFLFNHATLASSQDLFAQLWKEYALSDSRYLTSDPFMLCVEAISVVSAEPLPCVLPRTPRAEHRRRRRRRETRKLTTRTSQIVWGPLSFATAVSIARRGTLRHPLQIIVSVAHLYGVVLYYATCYAAERYQGIAYSRPEFQYFWVYYVGFNSPWVFVPAGKSACEREQLSSPLVYLYSFPLVVFLHFFPPSTV